MPSPPMTGFPLASHPTMPSPPASDPRDQAYGIWATAGFGVCIVLVALIAAGVSVVPFAIALIAGHGGRLEPSQLEDALSNHGGAIAVGTMISYAAALGTCFLVALPRRFGGPLNYVRLRAASRSSYALGLLLAVLVWAGSDLLSLAAGYPIVPDWQRRVYDGAGFWIPALWLAIIVMAPLGEEVFFRGFLYAGFARSRLRPWGAILLIALIWAVIHTQYGPFYQATIFASGIALGFMRKRSNSVLPCIAMHMFQNFVSTIETHIGL